MNEGNPNVADLKPYLSRLPLSLEERQRLVQRLRRYANAPGLTPEQRREAPAAREQPAGSRANQAEACRPEPAPGASDEAVGDDTAKFQHSSRDDIEALEAAVAKDVGPVHKGAFKAVALPNNAALSKLAAAFGKRLVGFAVSLRHRKTVGFFNGVIWVAYLDALVANGE